MIIIYKVLYKVKCKVIYKVVCKVLYKVKVSGKVIYTVYKKTAWLAHSLMLIKFLWYTAIYKCKVIYKAKVLYNCKCKVICKIK